MSAFDALTDRLTSFFADHPKVSLTQTRPTVASDGAGEVTRSYATLVTLSATVFRPSITETAGEGERADAERAWSRYIGMFDADADLRPSDRLADPDGATYEVGAIDPKPGYCLIARLTRLNSQ